MSTRLRRRDVSIALLLPLLWTGGGGCVAQPVEPPQVLAAPDHGPTHGQRRTHRHDRVELVYDASLDLYRVDESIDVYWDGRRYLRRTDGAWQASLRFDGVWVQVEPGDVPARLVFWHERGYGAAGPVPASPAP